MGHFTRMDAMNPGVADTFDGALISLGSGFLGSVNLNPLNLPPYTIRLRYRPGDYPEFSKGSARQVGANTWELTTADEENPGDWSLLLSESLIVRNQHLQAVLGANSTGVTNMNDMFDNCDELADVQLFDTSTVTTMQGMFQWCTSLEQVPLFDLSNVTDVGGMFLNCHSLRTVPPFNTSNVTYTHNMFFRCTSMTKVPMMDLSRVENMSGMFAECSSLVEVPLFDTSSVVNMADAFLNCYSLKSVPLFNTSKIVGSNLLANFGNAFDGCTKVEGGALALYNQISSQEDPPTSIQYGRAFMNCGLFNPSGYAELEQIPTDWGGLKN